MVYRQDPVPGTGKKGIWRWGWYYKYPRTIQEKRQAASYPGMTRSRRNARNLPSAWDDRPRSDCGHRSWKRFGKHRKQWMR